MHIPDGFLTVPVGCGLYAAAVGSVGAAVVQVKREPQEPRTLALTGVCAAFIFAAQMFNFPVAGGTTGHLLGAALATVLLGPWRAILVMTAVLLIQTFGFADGGVVAFGANLFNMGVAGCLLTGVVYPAMVKAGRGSAASRTAGLAVSGWLSVVLASLLCALELAASGTVPAGMVVPAMVGIHALIGVGEALLSVAAYQVLAGRLGSAEASQPWLVAGGRGTEAWRLAAVLALGLVVVRLAFPRPDGLEQVAETAGFADQASARPLVEAPLPDYNLPGRSGWAGTYLSAILGMGACGLLMWGTGAGLGRRPRLAGVPAEQEAS